MIIDKLKILKKPFLFVGIGNALKGDDGLGPEIIRKLQAEVSFSLVECGEVPENYLKQITNHQSGSIFFVDAIEMGKEPGTIELFNADQIVKTGMFTHGMSLDMMVSYISEGTKAEMFLLGIQPKTVSFDSDFSSEVSKSIDILVSEIKSLDGDK